MPRDVVLHGALLEGTGTQMDKPLAILPSIRVPMQPMETRTIYLHLTDDIGSRELIFISRDMKVVQSDARIDITVVIPEDQIDSIKVLPMLGAVLNIAGRQPAFTSEEVQPEPKRQPVRSRAGPFSDRGRPTVAQSRYHLRASG